MAEQISLKEYVDRRFNESKEAVQAALQAAEKAVGKAETAADKRFEAANEVKATFSGEISRKLDRTEYIAQHKALEDKVEALTNRFNKTEGRSRGLNAGWGYLAAGIGMIIAIVSFINK